MGAPTIAESVGIRLLGIEPRFAGIEDVQRKHDVYSRY